MIYCKKCLSGVQAEAYEEMIEACRAAIGVRDRTEDGEMERRMALCQSCEFLLAATCRACGCYAELRAMKKASHCPKKKW